MWTIENYLTKPYAVLRCTLCGVEKVGNFKQAAKGKLRCWTCKPSPSERKASEQKATTETPLQPKVATAETATVHPLVRPAPDPRPKRVPLAGRVESNRSDSYSRAIRYQTKDDADGTQHGRIEIPGFRTRNPLNKRLTWQAVKGLSAAVKRDTMDALERCLDRPEEENLYAYDVKLVRVSVREKLDDDGVAAALKAVRDAFSIFVRINDGNTRRIRWTYAKAHARIGGIILEWKRSEQWFAEEPEETFLFFEDKEIEVLVGEHRVVRQHWKERMTKRLASRTARGAGAGDDEQAEDAAYDADEGGEEESTDTG